MLLPAPIWSGCSSIAAHSPGLPVNVVSPGSWRRRRATGRASEGAGLTAHRARAELAIAGRRSRSVTRNTGKLTAAEERVASLAAAGLGNREIAAELFVTRKAVEYHLSNIYRKLGVKRAALRSRLAAGGSVQASLIH